MEKDLLDKVYRETPLDKIPWNLESPPKVLVELVENGKLTPCKAIDLGCGAGNYAIYLARKGFDVLGVDLAPTAIKLARENAVKKNAECKFLVADLLNDLSELPRDFEFGYDYEVLHHIFPEKRAKYAENVSTLLKPGAKYLSVCFSEEDPQFGGEGKYRETRLGTVLYFSSEDEIRTLFKPHFQVLELKTIEIAGKYTPHLAVCAYMERK
ncbi:MAG: class I SAM-dependent methyltransferase [Candidatus Hodarchaeota archaeon]